MAFNYSPKIITDGLIFYLDAANSKSYDRSISGNTVWNDLSQSKQNCTLVNGATFDSSNLGSIALDGVNDYVVTNSTFPLPYNQITYSLWIKCGVLSTEQEIFGSGYQGSLGFLCFFRGPNSYNIAMQYSNGASYLNTAANSMWNISNDNTWIEITAAVDYSGATILWYRNGVLLSGPNSLTTPVAPSYPFKRVIGAYSVTPILPTKGKISNVRFYNRLLSSTEILQNYNTLKGRYT